MSVDTRTPRTPSGGRSSGFDDEPQLIMAKVPCDPAQVIVNHASFRVRLAEPPGGSRLAEDTVRLDAVPSAPRRRPVVWTGRTGPGGDPAAAQLLQAVRHAGGIRGVDAEEAGAATQVLPRVRLDDPPTGVIGPRSPRGEADATAQLPLARSAPGEYPRRAYDDGPGGLVAEAHLGADDEEPRRSRRSGDSVRHAYYPGRRMNLGVVLLPMRIFLGLISIYAGMGKLSDPVYFDGGERGSMVTWLQSLHPWPMASPLRDLALAHPVGAGLTVAFLQVVVGVLTVFGLWQRVAAAIGALLSAALIVTVSWRTVPAYDAPDIIYLAAWSPLIIAGAPVYSMDARLAGEAWRRLGPRVEVWQLRRRVLRRGTVMVSVIAGLTLLFGSMLGGAVRTSDMVNAPGPSDPPTNDLPGSPLPRKSEGRTPRDTQGPAGSTGAPATRERTPAPSASVPSSSAPGAVRESGTIGSGNATVGGQPSQTQGAQGAQTAPQAPQPQEQQPAAPETTSAGPSSTGGTGGAGDTAPAAPGGGSAPGAGGGGGGGSTSGGGSSGGALGGLLG
ncbi:DoxX family protein [Streptomyces sp. SAJ15]|uniref:DoxX family protein n=1 Tax=Streptomyces sp. SAJ15 TaxID=2011095 RepID=UPI001186180D|nr:DoxX family protein [Streptomyces sp. SAJ15]TVL88024.1 hypothetical protein CD790_32255 [Streptomyces sp. SAJ15]